MSCSVRFYGLICVFIHAAFYGVKNNNNNNNNINIDFSCNVFRPWDLYYRGQNRKIIIAVVGEPIASVSIRNCYFVVTVWERSLLTTARTNWNFALARIATKKIQCEVDKPLGKTSTFTNNVY